MAEAAAIAPSSDAVSNVEAREARSAADSELEAREARLQEREAALQEREQALEALGSAMQLLKAEVAAEPAAPEVARTPKRRPRRRGRHLIVVAVSPSRRRSPLKARRCRLSTASTAASSSSPRRSRRVRQYCGQRVSKEEPPPAPMAEQDLYGYPEQGADEAASSLLCNAPFPLGISAWDWPLSRDEKKSLVLLFDRQELMVQRDEFADQVVKLRTGKR